MSQITIARAFIVAAIFASVALALPGCSLPFGTTISGSTFKSADNAPLGLTTRQVVSSVKISSDAAVEIPSTLSATGLFKDTAALEPAEGIIEYSVQVPFWSDRAVKRHWIALPGQSTIAFSAMDNWKFPVGTVLVEHIELNIHLNFPLRLETRVLVHHEQGWQGYTYRWNEQQSDAELLIDSEVADYFVPDPTEPGLSIPQRWTYPSRQDCTRCHTAGMGYVLGVRTLQLNRSFKYPLALDNQLRAWNAIGLFDHDIGPAFGYFAYTSPDNSAAPLEQRARSYMAVNCATCHYPDGPAPGAMDFRYEVPRSMMNLIGVTPIEVIPDQPSLLRVRAGSKEQSLIWLRIQDEGIKRMPPIGNSVVDPLAAEIIGQWIDGL